MLNLESLPFLRSHMETSGIGITPLPGQKVDAKVFNRTFMANLLSNVKSVYKYYWLSFGCLEINGKKRKRPQDSDGEQFLCLVELTCGYWMLINYNSEYSGLEEWGCDSVKYLYHENLETLLQFGLTAEERQKLEL